MKISQNRVLLLLGVALAALAYHHALFWEPLVPQSEGPVEGFFFEPQHASPQLVYTVVAYLLWRRRQRIRAALGSPSAPLVGAPLLLLGVAQFLWSVSTGAMDLRILSSIPTALGIALLIGGRALLDAVLRPILLLLFAIPIPAVVVNQMVFPLQMWTADLSTWMLSVLSIPAVQQGDLIYARQWIFQVIESCSGMRSISTLALASVAYAELLDRQRLHAALLLLISPVVAQLLNGMRVVSIVLLAGEDASQDHTLQGIVIIVCGVLVLHGIDLVLERWLPDWAKRTPRRAVPAPVEPGAFLSWGTAAGVAALGLMASATLWLQPWQPPIPQSPWGVPLPREWGGYESRQLQVDKVFLGSVRFKRQLARAYEQGGARVEIFIGYDDLLDRWRNAVSPKVGLPGSGADLLERTRVSVPGLPEDVERVLVRTRQRRTLSLSWYEGARGIWREMGRGLVALDHSPLRGRRGITAVRISTPIEASSDGESRADERLRQFATELRPLVLSAEERVWGAGPFARQ
jgi:EpsI family protein